ncbi:MAG: tetraacyldisaccharide 4'-kinase [Caulobacteraceae bacterium]
MKLATPRNWYRRDPRRGLAARLILTPPSWIWTWATARRLARGRPYDPGIPVIRVGNLTMGGSGKTPVAREIARRLRGAGVDAHILSRGHGGRLTGPLRVGSEHGAGDVGDEAVMLAADLPVWIARDRAAGARAAARGGAAVIVMDDGHQNPAVKVSLSLVIVDGETRDGEWPFGDGAVFPAGPMREPLAAGLSRADAIVVVAPADIVEIDPALLELFDGKPLLIARLTPDQPPPPGRQIGFAGLAKPWKMERALVAAGCDLVDFAPLPDHARLDERALRFLADRARALDAGLVTSEKDWARLAPEWRERVSAWPVRATFEDGAALEGLLRRVCG